MKNNKKKILFPVVAAIVIVLTMGITAFAELVPTNNQWNVSFNENKKMVSDFKKETIADSVSGLQPGDYTDIVLNLKNDNSATVDWYMTNKVIQSLEETRSGAEGLSGGAYTYILTFKNNKDTGNGRVLFSSDTVGGEGESASGEGLHEATNALGDPSLGDWLFLDTFKKGEGGTITLRVALDGETQGNDYQDTLAELQMNFAVELDNNETENNNTSNRTSNNTSNRTSNGSTTRSSTNNVVNEVVRTGDETNMVPYFIAAGVSGLFLLALAIYSLRERRKQKGGNA